MKAPLLFIALTMGALMNGCASSREVIVYSFVTDAGRDLGAPSPEKPARCALGTGCYHEWGGIRAGAKPAALAFVDPLVRAALEVKGYAGLRRGEPPDLVVIFQWGCLRPDIHRLPAAHTDAALNQVDLLDLVGARALASTDDRRLHSALVEAAGEERYFLIVSAYLPPLTGEDLTRLVWRTQCSLPLNGLSQEQAFPILAAAGAVHFGRETAVPEFVTLDVEQALRGAARHAIR